MKFNVLLVVLPVLAMAACAKSPSAIAPVSMGDAYGAVSCQQAQAMLNAERAKLAPLESAQTGAVMGDAVGVFLVGVPVASLTGGDREGEIATSKGKIVALEARLQACQ